MKTTQQTLRRYRNKAGSIMRGIVLPVVLIFLLLMTAIGIAVIRNVTMEEKMSGNSRNFQVAFQSAEHALRYCENIVMAAGTLPVPSSVPAAGPFYIANGQALPTQAFYPDSTETDANKNWKNMTLWNGASAAGTNGYAVTVPQFVNAGLGVDESQTLARQALCMVERLSFPPTGTGSIVTSCPFRVTARGFGGVNADAEIVLQSYLNVPIGKWNGPC